VSTRAGRTNAASASRNLESIMRACKAARAQHLRARQDSKKSMRAECKKVKKLRESHELSSTQKQLQSHVIHSGILHECSIPQIIVGRASHAVEEPGHYRGHRVSRLSV